MIETTLGRGALSIAQHRGADNAVESDIGAAKAAIRAFRILDMKQVVAAWTAEAKTDERFSPRLPPAQGGSVGNVCEYDNQYASVMWRFIMPSSMQLSASRRRRSAMSRC